MISITFIETKWTKRKSFELINSNEPRLHLKTNSFQGKFPDLFKIFINIVHFPFVAQPMRLSHFSRKSYAMIHTRYQQTIEQTFFSLGNLVYSGLELQLPVNLLTRKNKFFLVNTNLLGYRLEQTVC
jgi:hypothetical protein